MNRKETARELVGNIRKEEEHISPESAVVSLLAHLTVSVAVIADELSRKVVRCKDCRWYKQPDCTLFGCDKDTEGFCDEGVRRRDDS